MPRSLALSAFLLGFSSLLLQIVMTRELLTSFLGNEVSIALVLLVWLSFVALGSAVGGRWFARRTLDSTAIVGHILPFSLAAGWALVASQLCGTLGQFPGQVIGPTRMLLSSALALGPLCLYLGLVFAALCRAGELETGRDQAGPIYSLEAQGAVAAGLLFHVALAEQFSVTVLLVLLGILAILGAVARAARRQWRHAIAFAFLAAAALGGSLAERAVIPTGIGLRLRFARHTVVAGAESRYGSIAVVRNGDQLVFYQSGLPSFTTEDVQANEIAVHPALLAHRRPLYVLMISGGLGGGLSEALKHPVARVDYVELDRKLIELAKEHLSGPLGQALRDPRVRLVLQDGRWYLRTCQERYDVILVLTPDPATTVISRFYTREFYRDVRRRLAPGGILCVGLSAAQARLSGPRRELHASVYEALKTVFPVVSAISGERTQYLAALRSEDLRLDYSVLAQRLRERRIQTSFVNETWLRFALGPLPREMLMQSLREARDVVSNCDARPIAAHLWLRTWLTELSPRLEPLFAAAPRFARSFWVLGLAALAGVFFLRRRQTLPRIAVSVYICGTGLIEMGAQLAVVMAYQAVVGNLYHRIALLMSLFMFGLAIGAWIGRRIAHNESPLLWWTLVGVLCAQAIAALCLPLLFGLAQAGLVWIDIVFALVSTGLGCMTGLSFPPAVRALVGTGVEATRAAARLYALDLAGAAAGAVLVGAVAIPAVGIIYTSRLLFGLIGITGPFLLVAAVSHQRFVRCCR